MRIPQLRALRFAVIPLLLAGCGGSPHAPEEKYFLVATNIKLPYWLSAQAGLNRASAQLGVKAELVGPDTYDPKAQHEEFQRILKLKPTGILVSAGDPKLLGPDVDEAITQGVPVITIDSDTPASKRVFFIGTDNYRAGTMGGAVAAKQLGGKGSVVIFTLPEQANLKERQHGYEDVFGGHPQIKIVQTVDIKGDPRIAFDTTQEIVNKKTPVDAFVCLEAIACPEVAEVLGRNKVTGKVVVAMDTDQRTLEWIQKGVISATIGQKPYTMAYYGLQALDRLHHHKLEPLDGNWAQNSFSPVPTFVDTGATLIDKSNVEVFLRERETSGSQKK